MITSGFACPNRGYGAGSGATTPACRPHLNQAHAEIHQVFVAVLLRHPVERP